MSSGGNYNSRSSDGTKIRANASGKLSKNEKGLKKLLSDVKEKVACILKEAEEIDQKENLELGNILSAGELCHVTHFFFSYSCQFV